MTRLKEKRRRKNDEDDDKDDDGDFKLYLLPPFDIKH